MAYELRATGITFDETAAGFLRAAVPSGVINVIANERRYHRRHRTAAIEDAASVPDNTDVERGVAALVEKPIARDLAASGIRM